MTVAGLDVGTSAVKGIALSETGEVVGRAEAGYPLSTPRPGWSEQDPEDWWRAAREVLEALGDVRAVGLSGQMHGLVALDAADRVLRPAILWNDQRTGEQCAEIEERIGFDALVEATGNRALTGFTAPKLLWLRRHEPEVWRSIATVLLPKDYVRMRLSGEKVMDVSDASGTLLFDVGERRWSDRVCDALEIPREWLPEVAESVDAAGAGDQAAGALGVGVDRAGGPASVVLGTSGVVFAAQDAFAADPQARVHAFCHAVPGRWHAMGVMLSAAGALRWLRDAVAPGEGFAGLVAEADAWEPGCEGLTFLPYLAGERTPHADPGARAAFAGLTLRHDRGALVRSVLEGVAFGLRDSLDLLAKVGARPTAGRVSGGGARSDLWLRIVASVLDLPLERTAAGEGAAFGAALLGGVRAGVWSDVHEAVRATVRVTGTIEPVPGWVERYAEARETFRALYPALQGVR